MAAHTASMDWQEIGPRTPPAVPPAYEQMLAAGRRSDPLIDFLAAAAADPQPALLIVNDSHRSTLTRPALQALAALCDERQVKPRWRLLISAGTHTFKPDERAAFENALLDGLGLAIQAIDWNDARDANQHVDLGGFRLHRWLAEHRRILPIGSIEPHYFAGLTGAHKTLTIGCMLRDDIERNHAGALAAASDLLALDGNPVYDGIAAAVAAVQRGDRRACAINQVVADGKLLAVEVGDCLATLKSLAPLARDTFLHTLDRPVDLLRLETPAPLGSTLYQADKALKNNHLAVRDGGGILLVADCEDGVGPDAFFDLLRAADTYAGSVAEVQRRGYRLGDHKAVKLRHLTDRAARGVRVALVSRGVRDEQAATAGLKRFDDEAGGLAWLLSVLPPAVGPWRGLTVHDAGNVGVTAGRAKIA